VELQSIQQYKKISFEAARQEAISVDLGFELVPVGEWALSEATDFVGRFREWRVSSSKSFFSEVQPSSLSAASYLRDRSVNDPHRILFGIYIGSSLVGHLGLSKITVDSAHLDSVMKSSSSKIESDRDFMRESIEALIIWGASKLGIKSVFLEVRSDNQRAIALYDRCGFHEFESRQLRVSNSRGYFEYVDAEPAKSNTTVRKLILHKQPVTSY
jgi:RimJ/RimL family protein N-acetyltransferase